MNTLVRIGDAARRLDVSAITLRRLEHRGAIPPARRHPRTGARYWLEGELDDIRRVTEPRPVAGSAREWPNGVGCNE